MGNLTNEYINQTYPSLVKFANSYNGVSSSLQNLQDGIGDNLPIQISTDTVNISGSFLVNGQPISVDTGSLVTTASFNAYTSSNDTRVNALISQTGSYVTETESGSFMITGSVAGDTLTFTKGNGSQFSLQVNTGSLPAGTISGSQQIVDLGFATTGSVNQKLDTGSFNAYTSSNDSKVNSLIAATGSYVTETESGSFVTNVSVNPFLSPNQIDVTKGDGITNGYTIDYVVHSISSSLAANAISSSFATNAVTASVSYDLIVYGKCDNPAGLTKGTIVRITGANGDNPLFNTASWVDDNNSANTLGMLTNNVAYNAFANIVVQGTVIGINTNGMTAGDMLYLSSSGQYTNVIPPAPYHEVRLGQVLRPQLNNGSAYISIDNGYELNELHDVDITNPVNGDLLVYRSGSYGQWVNETGAELGYATTGSNTFQDTQTINAALIVNGPSGNLTVTGNTQVGGYLRVGNGANITGSVNVSGTVTSALGFNGDLSGTASFATNALSASYAPSLPVVGVITTGSINTSQSITGSLNISSSANPTNGGLILGNDTGIQFKTAGGNKSTLYYSGSAGTRKFVMDSSDSSTSQIVITGGDSGGVSIGGGAGAVTTPVNITGSLTVSGSSHVINGTLTHTGSINQQGNIFLRPQFLSGITFNHVTQSNEVSSSNIIGIMLNQPTSTGSIVLSGSNNIILNALRATTPVGSIGLMNGSGNILTSTVFPTLSSGSLGTFTFDRNIGIGVPTVFAPYSSSAVSTIINNVGANGFNVNNYSGSTNIAGNGLQGTLNINNYVSSSTIATSVTIQQNIIAGTHTVTLSGSTVGTGQPKSLVGNLIGGNTNTIYGNTTNNTGSLLSTLIVGNNLIVSASSGNSAGIPGALYGGAFIGRYNDDSGTLANSHETIFAVGTGTGTGAKRTSLLVSGSGLTVVRDGLSVTGSLNATSITGSLEGTASYATNALTASYALNGGGGTINTGSFATTGSNIFIGDQTITGSINTTGGATFGNNQSQYNNLTLKTSVATYPGNIFNSFGIDVDNSGQYSAGMYVSTYTSFGSNPVTAFYGGGNGNVLDGGNTAMVLSGGDIYFQKDTFFTGSIRMDSPLTVSSSVDISGTTTMSGNNGFPLYVNGTINSERLHFDSNPFNTNPSSNLGAIRFDANNLTFYSTNYDTAQITTQSQVFQTVNTGSGIVETGLQSNNAGSDYYLKLRNQSGVGTLTTNANTIITGSLNVTNGITGSLQGTASYAVTASYALNGGGGAAFPFTGSAVITGSLTMTGSLSGNVTALTITSQTASLDLSRGNFFSLQLPVGAVNTFINPTNIIPGQTVNVLLNTSGSGNTVTFPTSVKQISGSSYVPTIGTSRDIITFISYDTSSLYLMSAKNFSA